MIDRLSTLLGSSSKASLLRNRRDRSLRNAAEFVSYGEKPGGRIHHGANRNHPLSKAQQNANRYKSNRTKLKRRRHSSALSRGGGFYRRLAR